MNQGLFIVGTDTGVGKTFVATAICRALRELGVRAVGIKPVETGCVLKDGELFPEDGAALQAACDNELPLKDCAPFRFTFPAAPARAAALDGARLSVADLAAAVERVATADMFVVVEGAGGLMVPINNRELMIDLVQELRAPTILVGRSRLGAINHVLLSLEALAVRNVPVSAVVLSQTEETQGPEEPYTPEDLADFTDVPILRMPRLSQDSHDPAAGARIILNHWPRSVISRWTHTHMLSQK